MSSPADQDFRARYGRWALVIGASEGVGTAAAEILAARGLDLLLVARNAELLGAVARDLRDRHRVEVATIVQDLVAPDAVERLLAACDGREVGLIVHTVGAVHNAQHFLDQPLDLAMRMIQINCTVPVALVHALAPPMRARGRGGIVLVGSTGCFSGGPRMVAYSAAKAFQVNFAEGLWAELHDDGVDVLEAVIGSTNTPARVRTLGVAYDESQDMSSEAVAREMVDAIGDGPTRVIARDDAGIGVLNQPWSEFRARALTTLLDAMEGFAARTTLPGV